MLEIILAVALLLFMVLVTGIRIVRPVEVGLVERFGKFTRTARQGLHWIIPIVDRMFKVNVTENMVDINPQKIITKDDLNATVDAVVYFRVKEANKALYEAADYAIQITSLARTTLRDIIGKMSLSDANSKRDELNNKLESELDKQTNAWGIDVIRVEIQRIEPPTDVQESMNQVVKAEREKIAAKDFALAKQTEADGIRMAEIKKSEGVKQGIILRAEGEAKGKVTIADADAKMIEVVNTSIRKHFKDEAQTYKALDTFRKSFENNVKYVVDSKSNMVNVMTEMAGTPMIPLPDKNYKDKKK